MCFSLNSFAPAIWFIVFRIVLNCSDKRGVGILTFFFIDDINTVWGGWFWVGFEKIGLYVGNIRRITRIPCSIHQLGFRTQIAQLFSGILNGLSFLLLGLGVVVLFACLNRWHCPALSRRSLGIGGPKPGPRRCFSDEMISLIKGGILEHDGCGESCSVWLGSPNHKRASPFMVIQTRGTCFSEKLLAFPFLRSSRLPLKRH